MPNWRLIYDPRGMDTWGSQPQFTATEIRAALRYGDYTRSTPEIDDVLPFARGCRFQHIARGTVAEVRISGAKLVFAPIREVER
jgi:hypothetical protein